MLYDTAQLKALTVFTDLAYYGVLLHHIWWTSPPTGAARTQPTPTAQAAASISLYLDSFWNHTEVIAFQLQNKYMWNTEINNLLTI